MALGDECFAEQWFREVTNGGEGRFLCLLFLKLTEGTCVYTHTKQIYACVYMYLYVYMHVGTYTFTHKHLSFIFTGADPTEKCLSSSIEWSGFMLNYVFFPFKSLFDIISSNIVRISEQISLCPILFTLFNTVLYMIIS